MCECKTRVVSNATEFNECRYFYGEELKQRTKEQLDRQGYKYKPKIWYRGHASEEYELVPSLLRLPKVQVQPMRPMS